MLSYMYERLLCLHYSLYFFNGWAAPTNKAKQSFPRYFLVALSCLLAYCNRDCSLPPWFLRLWLGGGISEPFSQRLFGASCNFCDAELAGLRHLQPLPTNYPLPTRERFEWFYLSLWPPELGCIEDLAHQHISRTGWWSAYCGLLRWCSPSGQLL